MERGRPVTPSRSKKALLGTWCKVPLHQRSIPEAGKSGPGLAQRQVGHARGPGGRAAGPAPGEGARAAPRRHLSCWAPKGKGLSPPTGASAALGKLRMAAPTLLYLFVYFYRNLLVHSPSLSSSVSMEQH